MPENLLNGLQRDSVGEHEAGSGVPQIVETNIRQPDAAEQTFVGAMKVHRFDWAAIAIAEDQIEPSVTPIYASGKAFFELPSAVRVQGSDGILRQWNRPARLQRLRLGQLKFTANSLQRAHYPKLGAIEIDVSPSQAQQFTTAKPQGEADRVYSLEPLALGRL